MTTPHEDGSTRITGPSSTPSRTQAGADVTSRMTGTHSHDDHTTTGTSGVQSHTTTVRPGQGHGTGVGHAKTSAAAVFGLVFGLAALFCALTAILSPAAVLFGLIGLVLSIVGMKMAKRVGVTGKGVAIGGLVTSLLGLLIGIGVLSGLAVAVNSEGALDRISNGVDDLRAELPSGSEVQNQVEDTVNG